MRDATQLSFASGVFFADTGPRFLKQRMVSQCFKIMRRTRRTEIHAHESSQPFIKQNYRKIFVVSIVFIYIVSDSTQSSWRGKTAVRIRDVTKSSTTSPPIADHLHVVVGVSTARAGSQESVVAASVFACCAAVCEAQDSRRFTFIESGVVP